LVETREDIIAKYFTIIVLIIGATAGVYWYSQGRNDLMWNAFTTVLIIACPCALLLAKSFTNGHLIRMLSAQNMYLKNVDIIADIVKIDHIVFDKTGTLTQNDDSKISFEGNEVSERELNQILNLLYHSKHPLCKAVLDFYQFKSTTLKVENFLEHAGKGIEGIIENKEIKIGNADFLALNESRKNGLLYIKIDNEYKGVFKIEKKYRFRIFDFLEKIKKKYSISLISGDNEDERPIMEKFFAPSQLFFNQKPDEKLTYIKKLQANGTKVCMIGDGLNDAMALKQSNIGVALTEKNNNFTPSADIILSADKLAHFFELLEMIKHSQRVIIYCFIFSFLFNIIGLYFSVQGILSPLIAAILMTCSSLSIIGMSYFLLIRFKK
jgi:Cu+-exporting ATPase